jgi:hypothetical protein
MGGQTMSFPSSTLSAPSLSTYQMQYNGLTLGPGTGYRIQKLEGLDLPNVRSGDVARPRDHGELIGLDLMAGRDVVLTLQVATDGTSLQHALSAFASAFGSAGVTEAPLYLQLPNLPLLAVMCRPRQRTVPIDLEGYTVAGVASVAVQLHATDPRLYVAPSIASTTSAPTPAGGLTFPVTFPVSFGGGSSTADLFPNNVGNIEMRPILVITGPCTNPKVANDQTGWSLTFTNPSQSSFTLYAGDTLTVDLDSHSVQYLVSGTTVPSSERGWVVPGSIWPNATGIAGLEPGVQTIQFSTTDSGVVAATLTLEYASAYMI